MNLDGQQVEIIGQNLLVSLFVADDVEIAFPARDRGIDLIAYYDIAGDFQAVPIQMKSFSRSGFSIDAKYARFPGLLLAYVWHVREPLKSELYIMTYQQALEIAGELGWTKTRSWTEGGKYSTNQPSAKVRTALEPHRYEPGKLAKIVRGLI